MPWMVEMYNHCGMCYFPFVYWFVNSQRLVFILLFQPASKVCSFKLVPDILVACISASSSHQHWPNGLSCLFVLFSQMCLGVSCGTFDILFYFLRNLSLLLFKGTLSPNYLMLAHIRHAKSIYERRELSSTIFHFPSLWSSKITRVKEWWLILANPTIIPEP